MKIQRCLKLALMLILGLSCYVAEIQAQDDSGAVPSKPQPSDSGSGSTPPPTTNAKPLPWKFLAKPMGALDAKQWNSVLTSFDCDDAPKCPMPDDDKLTDLFRATIGEKQLRKSKPIYVVLHVVQYPESAKDGSTSSQDLTGTSISDHWYLYRSSKSHYGDPKWTYEKFSGQRIYGASSVFFLFLQVNAGVVTLQNATRQVNCMIQIAKGGKTDKCGDDTKKNQAIKTDLEQRGLADALRQLPDGISDDQISSAINPGTLADLSDKLANLSLCQGGSGDHFQWLGASGISSTYARIRYEAAVVKRTPANIENLKTILGLLLPGAQASAAELCLKIAGNDVLWGAGRIDNIALPSDISIAGYSVKDASKPIQEVDRSSTQIGTTGSYNDEQLYWWDASIGIPVHTIKDLQYSDSNNTVTATQVDKQSAYAMFNLMIHPVDLS